MRKVWILVLTIGLILGGMVGCTSTTQEQQPTEQKEQVPQDQGDQQQSNEKQPDEKKPTQTDENKTKPDAKDTPQTNIGDLTSIKQNLKLGMTEAEVKKVFGEPNAIDKQTQQWRYDMVKEGYHFEEKVMAVDVEGLKTGKMKAQLFVHYKDGSVVDSYYVYYLKGDEIIQHTVNMNGESEGPASAD